MRRMLVTAFHARRQPFWKRISELSGEPGAHRGCQFPHSPAIHNHRRRSTGHTTLVSEPDCRAATLSDHRTQPRSLTHTCVESGHYGEILAEVDSTHVRCQNVGLRMRLPAQRPSRGTMHVLPMSTLPTLARMIVSAPVES